MRSPTLLALTSTLLLSTSFAAPTTLIAPSNPLASLPHLTGFASRPGFAALDPDGIYRAYLSTGAVVDAARLTPAQIETYLSARAPHLSPSSAAAERALLQGVDSTLVPEEELLAPREGVRPVEMLKQMNEGGEGVSEREVGPLEVGKRQIGCPSFYCTSNAGVCRRYGCFCNGVICTLF